MYQTNNNSLTKFIIQDRCGGRSARVACRHKELPVKTENGQKDVRPRDKGRDNERHVLIGLGHTTGITRPGTLFPDP